MIFVDYCSINNELIPGKLTVIDIPALPVLSIEILPSWSVTNDWAIESRRPEPAVRLLFEVAPRKNGS